MRRANFRKAERFVGFRADPGLLTRIRNLMMDGEYLDAEELAFDLQQKYPEYSRRKFRDFVKTVQLGMDKIGDEGDGVNKEVKGNPESAAEDISNERKRKLLASSETEPIVTIDDDDSDTCDPNADKYVHYPDANMANKTLMKLYVTNKNDDTPDRPLQKMSKTSKQKSMKHKSIHKATIDSKLFGGRETSSLNIEPQKSSVTFADIGGCESQFLDVCRLSMHLKHSEIHERLGVQPPRGFLLHGPPGCGKTLFAHAVAGELNLPLLKIASTELISGISGESESKLRELFMKAQESAPCILLIDEIDVIAQKRDSTHREMEKRIVSQLIICLDDLNKTSDQKTSPTFELNFASNGDVGLEDTSLNRNRSKHVLVIGTTNRPESIDASLRRAGRFDKEIAIGIPDERARIKILEIVCSGIRLDESVQMHNLARLTPGYVGADLKALAREASMCAVNRVFETVARSSQRPGRLNIEETNEELTKLLGWLKSDQILDDSKITNLFVQLDDFKKALTIVHPSAKREGFVTVPDVSWQDIGALNEVREELKWSILYPIKKPEDFELLAMDSSPQGILLCGPPGCGKTLLAKAIANETGMNFISVKGPELLSMYVGESERAVRTVFQRARDSSPCVIFFDEIDALCPKRSLNESSGSARLVNQLLTEMDGIECRKQVFLIAATNRPDIVDPAILRPGRLDKVLFVDFPTQSDRADILRKATKNGTHPRIAADVQFDEIARNSALEWFTGADLVALVHEASVIALKERLSTNNAAINALTTEHFRLAMSIVKASVNENDRLKYEKIKQFYSKKN